LIKAAGAFFGLGFHFICSLV